MTSMLYLYNARQIFVEMHIFINKGKEMKPRRTFISSTKYNKQYRTLDILYVS